MFDKVIFMCTLPLHNFTWQQKALQLLILQGCTFLCVFGLPHAKHEDDAARALKAAREIFNGLSHLELK